MSLVTSIKVHLTNDILRVPFGAFNVSLPSHDMEQFDWSDIAKEFLIILEDAVRKRLVCSAGSVGAKVSILYSGGLDSTVLAALVDR